MGLFPGVSTFSPKGCSITVELCETAASEGKGEDCEEMDDGGAGGMRVEVEII